MKSFIYRKDLAAQAIVPTCWGPFDSNDDAMEAAKKLPPGAYVVTDGGQPKQTVTIGAPSVSVGAA